MLIDVVGGDGDKCWRLCEVCVCVCVCFREVWKQTRRSEEGTSEEEKQEVRKTVIAFVDDNVKEMDVTVNSGFNSTTLKFCSQASSLVSVTNKTNDNKQLIDCLMDVVSHQSID